MANVNWRTINIDALDPDSPANFDLTSLTPAVTPISTADVQSLAGQIRQLLRGGDNEGALQGALENAPYGADDKGKVRRRMLPHTTSPPVSAALPPFPPVAVGRYYRQSLRISLSRRYRFRRHFGPGLPVTGTIILHHRTSTTEDRADGGFTGQ
jgi:hypothetical protein